jgi:hypothetical protein
MLWLTVCIWGLVIALMATGNNAHVHQQDVGRDSLPWSTSRRQLVVPMEIQVVFLGLNGEADQNVFLDSESFVQVLERSLEATQAFSVQDQRGINVQYEFNYAATHAPRTSLVELSQILGQAFPARMRSPVCNKVTVPCGPDTAVTKFFDALYFDTISSQTTQKDMPSSYTVFVVNPSAAEILKVNHDEVLPFTYAYQYDGAAADSQSWIGRERYVVIDIGAGPVSLGSQEGDSSGGVGAASRPLSAQRP